MNIGIQNGSSHVLYAAMLTARPWDKIMEGDMRSLEIKSTNPGGGESKTEGKRAHIFVPGGDGEGGGATSGEVTSGGALGTRGSTSGSDEEGGQRNGSNDSSSSSSSSSSSDDGSVDSELRDYVTQYFQGITEILETAPRSVLFLMKGETTLLLPTFSFRVLCCS